MTNLHEALKTLRNNNQNGSPAAVTDDLLPFDQLEDEKIAAIEEQKKSVELCPW